MVQKIEGCLFVSTECTNVADGETDGQTDEDKDKDRMTA